MKGSIITGGLLGIALGAVAVFALAKGLPSVSSPDATAHPRTGSFGPAMIEDASGSLGAVPFRPLRPGSDRLGARRQS
jgi:hypothetical protein